jgi:hypothetical protein
MKPSRTALRNSFIPHEKKVVEGGLVPVARA